jgi:hypothetical protein
VARSRQKLRSNFWRTQQGPIRTASLIPANIVIFINDFIPLYQKLAPKAKELRALGMNFIDIGKTLKINKQTAFKSVNFYL